MERARSYEWQDPMITAAAARELSGLELLRQDRQAWLPNVRVRRLADVNPRLACIRVRRRIDLCGERGVERDRPKLWTARNHDDRASRQIYFAGTGQTEAPRDLDDGQRIARAQRDSAQRNRRRKGHAHVLASVRRLNGGSYLLVLLVRLIGSHRGLDAGGILGDVTGGSRSLDACSLHSGARCRHLAGSDCWSARSLNPCPGSPARNSHWPDLCRRERGHEQ